MFSTEQMAGKNINDTFKECELVKSKNKFVKKGIYNKTHQEPCWLQRTDKITDPIWNANAKWKPFDIKLNELDFNRSQIAQKTSNSGEETHLLTETTQTLDKLRSRAGFIFSCHYMIPLHESEIPRDNKWTPIRIYLKLHLQNLPQTGP